MVELRMNLFACLRTEPIVAFCLTAHMVGHEPDVSDRANPAARISQPSADCITPSPANDHWMAPASNPAVLTALITLWDLVIGNLGWKFPVDREGAAA